ncbi:4Fe-4S dicluster domain-containing protein [Marinisporobacter balticus]|uniref:Na+-translocating ferredoxin:NAD+ oxidoreductase RnfC subunit n=1 Tax=Marinisporobacter balticus TaxID=2018667 RepID=A0A4R2KVU5_9FIRM|nr:4Fe-4S dicluster domain-containing protein [Marinisporobacter balticus]TCO77953.1 Na+-translocating ferredoxin:NAD+ oxidoreductase RnfC subunit [Marinisporobacter balticus]
MEENFIDLIKEAGIIGAGGAGFPTHVKLNTKAEYIIVNGAECEPLLKVDQQLMAQKSDEILIALDKIVLETGAKKGIIALKKKYKNAVENLDKDSNKYEKLELFTLDNFYPAGDEQITVYEVLKRIVPEGGIPLNVGVIVINVETLLNVYNAMHKISVTDKYLTVTGAVKNPITIKVPIGISVADAIELAGGAIVDKFKVIDGGPMMGKIVEDIHQPIKKNTKGLIVLPENHSLILSKSKKIERMLKQARAACCHCSLCTDVCPRNLLGHKLSPDKLMRLASYNSTCESNSKITDAFLCSECGLCEQVCIMGLQPWKLNKFLKGQLSGNGIKNPNNNVPKETKPFREYRKFPVNKLKARLGIEKYDVDAPLTEQIKKEFKAVVIARSQHIGAPVEPIVNVGDQVTKGQLIGEIPDNKLGAKIHASINGIVKNITDKSILICRADN